MANQPLRLISAAELGDLPPTEWLGVTKFVAKGLNVVFGPSGSFKSFYALDACLRVAQSHPIIYIAGEGVGGLHRRVAAWCDHNKTGAGQAYFVGRAINLRDNDQVKHFCDVAKDLKPAMVVFDTLARCVPGAEENSARDMGLAIANTDRIRDELQTTPVWIHHTNRREQGERGSGAVRGAADNMIEVFPNGDGSIRVSCSKSKDQEKWVDEQLSFLSVLNSGVLIPTSGYAALTYSDQEIRILEFLSLETFTQAGAKVNQMVNSLNIPERTIYRMLSHLKSDCQITQSKSGDPYHLTDDGRATIGHRSATSPDIMEIIVE
jgi:hypothetical protein